MRDGIGVGETTYRLVQVVVGHRGLGVSPGGAVQKLAVALGDLRAGVGRKGEREGSLSGPEPGRGRGSAPRRETRNDDGRSCRHDEDHGQGCGESFDEMMVRA